VAQFIPSHNRDKKMIETLFSNVTDDGDTISPLLDRDYERGYLSIVFYNNADLEIPVSPTAGAATITASEDGKQYGDLGVIDADTAGVNSTYTRIAFAGMVRFVKVNMSGITGATHFQVRIAEYQHGQ
jgi:hypothetical protein